MKTQTYLRLLALTAAALSLNATTASAQYVDSLKSLKNRAVAASPRAKEVFPWLARSPAIRTEASCDVRTTRNELTAVKNNRALASSPRVREQFPELARAAQPAKSTDSSLATTVIRNRAWAASPRAREEFPWLARGSYTVIEEPFEIAPLK